MPFAQWHAPFENQEVFEQRFPADYICEGLDQTRGWFYSLLAISTMLFGRSSYETVLCLGLILDPEGQKMSKSRGNIVDPWDVLDLHGADAFRWYYFTSKQPWDGYRFSVDTVGESVRLFMQTLWNTYGFYVLYAERERRRTGRRRPDARTSTAGRYRDFTRRRRPSSSGWRTTTRRPPAAPSRDSSTTSRTGTCAVRGAASGTATRAHSATLRECLVTAAKLLAPLTPFIADEIYDNLDGTEPSVHLCDFPEPGERDPELEWQMQVARDAVELGRAARAHGKLKVRQPLAEAVIVAGDTERRRSSASGTSCATS